LPGSKIGILGSGQLGRMLAMAARHMGYKVHVYSPDRDTPCSPVVDREFVGGYEDLDQIREFARSVDLITFEFENVPHETAMVCAEHAVVRPDGRVLHIAQNRSREKNFLAENGIPTAPFFLVDSDDSVKAAGEKVGFPGILKTASFGYDGKGQVKVNSQDMLGKAFEELKRQTCVYEGFVSFDKELSVVAARNGRGEFAAFPVFENTHADHILDVTVCPAEISPEISQAAVATAKKIVDALEVVGLLTVEYFLSRNGSLVVNELAPRTHNSGHLTLNAAVTSQFEQQVRAITGLCLGSAELLKPAAMANILGHWWENGEPDWNGALRDKRVKLHLYGKAEPRKGRKMGHLTVCGETVAAAGEAVVRARQLLGGETKMSGKLASGRFI